MPKQVQKYSRFEGGINEGADPRDISENELVKSDNIIVDDLGKLRLIGKVDATAIQAYVDTHIKPGYGIFSYSTDYAADGTLANTDWIALLNDNDGNVELRHMTQGESATVIANAIDLGDNADDNEAQYYFADGALRVSQANLAKTKDTRWYGYIKENFYQTTDGGTSSGSPVAEKSSWVSITSSNKSPSELSVNLDLHEGTEANPSETTVGATAGDKIVVSYWKSANGGWNGMYSLACTFVYKGGAESSMTKFSESIVANDQKVSFQIYIPIGTDINPAADAGNGFGDDRIVGIRLYFKEFEAKSYTLLTSVDLLVGGDDHWLKLNSGATTPYGIFPADGSVVVNEPNKTVYGGVSDNWSFHNTTITVTIDNDADGFWGRSGNVRLFGGHVSPIYISAPNNLGDGIVTFPDTIFLNAGPGTRVLKAEILDESFNVLKESDEFEYEIQESGKEPPPDYDEEDRDEDYERDCFLWNTQILMASGDTKYIKDIKTGDIILSYSDKYKSFTNGIVTDTLIHPKNNLVHAAVVGNSLVTTPSHPIFVKGKWSEIQYSGLKYSIIDIYIDNFYNLEIDGQTIYGSDHNFIANRYIVSGLGDNKILNEVMPRQNHFMKSEKYG